LERLNEIRKIVRTVDVFLADIRTRHALRRVLRWGSVA
jgi:hypothetical protein